MRAPLCEMPVREGALTQYIKRPLTAAAQADGGGARLPPRAGARGAAAALREHLRGGPERAAELAAPACRAGPCSCSVRGGRCRGWDILVLLVVSGVGGW